MLRVEPHSPPGIDMQGTLTNAFEVDWAIEILRELRKTFAPDPPPPPPDNDDHRPVHPES